MPDKFSITNRSLIYSATVFVTVSRWEKCRLVILKFIDFFFAYIVLTYIIITLSTKCNCLLKRAFDYFAIKILLYKVENK